jgi:hypothetical protein
MALIKRVDQWFLREIDVVPEDHPPAKRADRSGKGWEPGRDDSG